MAIWALARIVETAPREFSTAAMVERIAPVVECYYPPLAPDKRSYTAPFALVAFPKGLTAKPSADVCLLPALDKSQPMEQLSAIDRRRLRSLLESRLPAYAFRDWNGERRRVSQFSAAHRPGTPFSSVVLDIFRHLAHSRMRPKPYTPEAHNTEYLDDFTTDTRANYTAQSGTLNHDAANGEIDVTLANNWGFRYTGTSPTAPGSIEHEAQCTYFGGSAGQDGLGGGAVRFHNAGTNDRYFVRNYHNSDIFRIYRLNAGTATQLGADITAVAGASSFFTQRLAAEGAVGASVVLTAWQVDHGTTKPAADPGWIDAVQLESRTDSAVDRLDDAEHSQGGVGGHWQGIELDNRIDWFKVRAISDRVRPTLFNKFQSVRVGSGMSASERIR